MDLLTSHPKHWTFSLLICDVRAFHAVGFQIKKKTRVVCFKEMSSGQGCYQTHMVPGI